MAVLARHFRQYISELVATVTGFPSQTTGAAGQWLLFGGSQPLTRAHWCHRANSLPKAGVSDRSSSEPFLGMARNLEFTWVEDGRPIESAKGYPPQPGFGLETVVEKDDFGNMVTVSLF